jgi:HAD superfamily hydrolase (TIGR01509 family)
MLKGVIFDWAGTCATEGEPLIDPRLHAKTGLGLQELNEKTVDLYNAYAVGALSTELFWQKILECFGLQDDTEITSEILTRSYLDSSKVFPQVLEVAADLRMRGVVVGLLSNSTPLMRDYLHRSVPTNNYFDFEAYSCDRDVADLKPHLKPFEVILKKMNVSPQETLFIDNSSSNIEAAEKLGMQTLLFITPERFVKDLKTRYKELYV